MSARDAGVAGVFSGDSRLPELTREQAIQTAWLVHKMLSTWGPQLLRDQGFRELADALAALAPSDAVLQRIDTGEDEGDAFAHVRHGAYCIASAVSPKSRLAAENPAAAEKAFAAVWECCDAASNAAAALNRASSFRRAAAALAVQAARRLSQEIPGAYDAALRELTTCRNGEGA